jgi:hypothetical protein
VLACKERPLAEDIGKRLGEIVTLLLAAQQGNTFAIFPHVRQRVAKFGFRLILDLGNVDEMATDDGRALVSRCLLLARSLGTVLLGAVDRFLI